MGVFLVAESSGSLYIVDQHAAHERLVYERLKRQMAETGVKAQALLIPEIIELNIGHAIVSRAVFDGLDLAVSEMKRLMTEARGE